MVIVARVGVYVKAITASVPGWRIYMEIDTLKKKKSSNSNKHRTGDRKDGKDGKDGKTKGAWESVLIIVCVGW